jgi:hypothetical protein
MLFFFFFTITADRFIALGSTICGGATDGETGAKKLGRKVPLLLRNCWTYKSTAAVR